MYDIIIIGSGPAGLTASIYAIRASLKTLVIAGYNQGGQLMLTTLVENYPGFPKGIEGPVLMQNMRKQAENLGVEFVDKDAVEIDVSKRPFKVYTELSEEAGPVSQQPHKFSHKGTPIMGLPVVRHPLESHSLIIATGADTKWLEVAGEKELIGKGVSSCAPCDAFFFKNKNVAVVGGGDSAMEEALVLAKVANSVTIIHRKSEFRASKIMQERIFANPKIKVIWDTEVVEVLGKEKVIGLRLKSKIKNQKSKIQVKSQNGEGEVWDFPIDGVFVAIGHKPNSEKFVGKIDLDQKGYVMQNQNSKSKGQNYETMTNIEGVFVAGDVHDYRYKQAVTAAGFGCMAALDVEKWLEENK